MQLNKNNPYAPPKSVVQVHRQTYGSPIKAVLFGVLTDVGGSIAVSLLLVIAKVALLVAAGLSAEQIESTLMKPHVNSPLYIAGYILGGCFSLLGGYVCARVAKRSEYKLAATVAVISTTFGLVLAISHYSFLMNTILAMATIFSVMAGAWLGVLKNVSESKLLIGETHHE